MFDYANKNSTMVDLYDGLYLFPLPEVPSDEKDIIGFDLKKKDQYWRTTEFPDEFSWNRMTKREQYEIVDRERYRYENGVWFFNNGEPTYITGMHYDHMVNMTFDFGKASYYDSQRLDFYFREYIYQDPTCFGQCTIKPRRYGYSIQEITNQNYEGMRNFNNKVGMMSNNKDKTIETLFDPLILSYMQRPEWLRPNIYLPNGQPPKRQLLFNNGKVKNGKSYKYDTTGALNSKIWYKPTTVLGYDGNKLQYLTLDEAWKWTLANPYECYKKQRPCFKVGSKIIGKCSVLSTMGDDDDYEEAITAGIQMFQDSDPTNRDDNGHTTTGLYHRFISGVNAMFDYSDVYGKINVDQATTYILNGRKSYPEGSTDWTYEVRRYPLTLQEAISTAAGIGIFNNQRITARIEILKKTPALWPVVGKLDEDLTLKEKDRKVIWTPDNNGDFQVWKLPKITKEFDFSNRWKIDPIDGMLKMLDNPQGVVGYDAIRYAEMDTTSQKLSNAAIVGFQKFDYYGNGGANTIPFIYHARPEDPEIGHYEAYKASKFWGFPIATERQMDAVKRRMTELNALALMLVSHYDGKRGFWTTKTLIKDGVDLIQGFWKAPKTKEEVDYLMQCVYQNLLGEAMKFNTSKTTIYDLMMAMIMAFVGSLQIKPTVINDVSATEQINKVLSIIQPIRNDD